MNKEKMSFTYKCLDYSIERGKDEKGTDVWVGEYFLNRLDWRPKLAKYFWPVQDFNSNNIKTLANKIADEIVANLRQYSTTWSID